VAGGRDDGTVVDQVGGAAARLLSRICDTAHQRDAAGRVNPPARVRVEGARAWHGASDLYDVAIGNERSEYAQHRRDRVTRWEVRRVCFRPDVLEVHVGANVHVVRVKGVHNHARVDCVRVPFDQRGDGAGVVDEMEHVAVHKDLCSGGVHYLRIENLELADVCLTCDEGPNHPCGRCVGGPEHARWVAAFGGD
jgi:hypothetical protein